MTIFVAVAHDFRDGLTIISLHTTFDAASEAYFKRHPSESNACIWRRGVAAHFDAVGYWEHARDDYEPTGMVIEYEVQS